MTIVEDARAITGGVDTHADAHVAAALDSRGGLLGVKEFPATAAGYGGLLGWLGGFGTVAVAGIEGTGSYGAGLARHLAAAGIRVVEEICRPSSLVTDAIGACATTADSVKPRAGSRYSGRRCQFRADAR
jgi:hypothetical protein